MSSHSRFLIFPGQVTKEVLSLSRDTKVLMVESPWVFSQARTTSSELVVVRAALQALRERLLVKAFEVAYLESLEVSNLQQLTQYLVAAEVTEVTTFTLMPSAEKVLRQRLAEAGIALLITSSHLFLTKAPWHEEAVAAAKSEKRCSIFLRTKLGILITDQGLPRGGSWNLPQTDRQRLDLNITPPEANRYIDEARSYVASHFPKLSGGVGGVPAPVTFADAEDQLEYVLEANWQQAPERACATYVLPSVALGLISPQYVLQRALAQTVPLASQEGFIRPILKREYQYLSSRT